MTLIMILGIIAVATMIIGVAKYKLNGKEILISIGVSCGVAIFLYGGMYLIIYHNAVSDIEILNGEIIGKTRNEVSCQHSYSCNCRSVTREYGKNSSTSIECDTCYEHSYDINWNLQTNLGNDLTIDRIDSQGSMEPSRWTTAKKGDPVAVAHEFTNYIKANPQSILHNNDTEAFKTKIPKYPNGIYDYYHIDRILTIGVPLPAKTHNEWNKELSNILKVLGPKKQANVIVVLVNEINKNYSYAIQSAWLNGKKNDIIVIISITEYPKINWVQVLDWSQTNLLKVKLRDDIETLGTINEQVLPLIKEDVLKYYNRKSMADYSYLREEVEIHPIIVMIITIIGVVAGIIRSSISGFK